MYRISKKARNSSQRLRGGHYPEQIFVLSDIYCASSGDNFVQMMKQFKKVTVGRPTLGILDYLIVCTVDYDNFCLMFPLLAVWAWIKERNDGSGCSTRYRDFWTPSHLREMWI